MSRYREIEREDPDEVRLFLRDSVLARWGEPTVNFPSLSELVFEQVGLPRDTKIKLFSGRWVGHEYGLRGLVRGGYNPFTHTIYSAVGFNFTHGLPSSSNLDREMRDQMRGSASNAAMEKLIHGALRAAHVRGQERHEKESELYAEHAADILFLDASASAR